eukprot:jgi/Undpi1/8236/HiC_scaffold_25.g10706.m1
MMHSTFICALIAAAYAPEVVAFVPSGVLGVTAPSQARLASSSSPQAHRTTTTTRMAVSPGGSEGQTRREVVQTLWKTALAAGAAQTVLASPSFAEDVIVTASGLKIKKLVNGKGPVVEIGDLVGVRFKGNYGTYEFDNIFTTAEPYYMRAGVNTLVPGVEEALLLMKVGDKWLLTCPPALAFGNKGRPPSPGRPRIPPGAEVEYTLELVGLPGKEEDMVNTRDDSFTGDAFDSA